MNIIKSNTTLLYSFTFNVGTTKGFDNWQIGSYNTPVPLQKDDAFLNIGLALSVPFNSGGSGTIDIQDAGGTSLAVGGLVLDTLSATTANYVNFLLPLAVGPTVPIPGIYNNNRVVTPGYMKIVIGGAAVTAGAGRWDIMVIRAY